MSDSVGPYRVIRAIGAGGSARIDLATVERAYGFVRHVVLKRPLEHLREDPVVAASLRREAELGGRLRHPNIVAVLDAGEHAGYGYLALEYVEGASLRTLMHTDVAANVRPLPLATALSIVVAVARGLHEAHELRGADGAPLGLVHRDVSPGNILVDRDGGVKLSDFGIAKETRVTTLSGSLRGTVTYMAPEQCRGHAFDRRADIFSLGVILHELLTARRLFWAENDVASLHKVLHAPLPDPREIAHAVPAELAALTNRVLARDVNERLASAGEFADRIEAFAAREGLVLGARTVVPVLTQSAPVLPRPSTTMTIPTLPADEPSLVTVIELVDEPEVPVGLAFGASPADDERATPVRRPARSRIAWVAGACALVGIALGVMLALRTAPTSDARSTAPLTDAAIDAMPDRVIDARGVVTDDAAPVAPDATPDVAEPPVDAGVGEPRKRVTKPPPDAAPPEPTPPPERTPPPPNVEWNPDILLPTDRGSATTKP